MCSRTGGSGWAGCTTPSLGKPKTKVFNPLLPTVSFINNVITESVYLVALKSLICKQACSLKSNP